MCVLIFSTTFVWNFSHSKKNWARCDNKRILVKYLLFLSDFNVNRIFSANFQKKKKHTETSNFMEIRPMGAELFQADGKTDRHDEAESRFSQFYERA